MSLWYRTGGSSKARPRRRQPAERRKATSFVTGSVVTSKTCSNSLLARMLTEWIYSYAWKSVVCMRMDNSADTTSCGCECTHAHSCMHTWTCAPPRHNEQCCHRQSIAFRAARLQYTVTMLGMTPSTPSRLDIALSLYIAAATLCASALGAGLGLAPRHRLRVPA